MWQEILITDLTQMAKQHVCLAGWNDKLENIRLVTDTQRILERQLYIKNDLILRPKAVVRTFLTPLEECEAPHVEDHLWERIYEVTSDRAVDQDRWYELLKRTAKPSLEEIFGLKLHNNRNIERGTGQASLGTIKPRGTFGFSYKTAEYADEGLKRDYRLSFYDKSGEGYFNIQVTDLTLRYYFQYLLTQGLSEEDAEARIQAHLKASEVWLRLGFGREWKGWCWLQINGIYTFPDYLEGRTFDDFKKAGVTIY